MHSWHQCWTDLHVRLQFLSNFRPSQRHSFLFVSVLIDCGRMRSNFLMSRYADSQRGIDAPGNALPRETLCIISMLFVRSITYKKRSLVEGVLDTLIHILSCHGNAPLYDLILFPVEPFTCTTIMSVVWLAMKDGTRKISNTCHISPYRYNILYITDMLRKHLRN